MQWELKVTLYPALKELLGTQKETVALRFSNAGFKKRKEKTFDYLAANCKHLKTDFELYILQKCENITCDLPTLIVQFVF